MCLEVVSFALLSRFIEVLIVDQGRIVYEQYLLKNLVTAIKDDVDFVREKALKLNEEMLVKFEPISLESA